MIDVILLYDILNLAIRVCIITLLLEVIVWFPWKP